METDSKSAGNRSYGRGFFDGLRKAGVSDPGEFMNNVRLAEIERSITGVAKKVLAAVPAASTWTLREIHSELSRSGTNVERRVMDGCVNSLKESGLVREPEAGKFIRVLPKVKDEPSAAPQLASMPAISGRVDVTGAQHRSQEPLDELAECAAAVRDLAKVAIALASRIEEVAVGVEERTLAIREESAKLRQLQELLKSLA